jgi:peptidyl-tRNA hydrolase
MHDDPAHVEARKAQTDPWVMYLVVRSDLERTPDEVLVAAAEAAVRCTDTLGESEQHREAFGEWSQRSFRKVSVRAKGKHWERLLREYPGAPGHARGEPLVMALVPRRRSENDAFLRGLQVYNPAIAAPIGASREEELSPDVLCFVLNPSVPMSLGKSVAQVGHAVLMCAWSDSARADPEPFVRWRAREYPCAILESTAERWQRFGASPRCATVRDAGLTEVVAGSETVRAMLGPNTL